MKASFGRLFYARSITDNSYHLPRACTFRCPCSRACTFRCPCSRATTCAQISVNFSPIYSYVLHFRADLSASIYSHQHRSSQFNRLANIYLRTRQNELTGAHPATLNSIHLAATCHAPSITQGPAGESKRKRSRSSVRLRGITPEVRRPLHLHQAPQLHHS